MRPRRQERAGTAAADHFQLIAKTAATAARGTTAAHEPIAAIAAATARLPSPNAPEIAATAPGVVKSGKSGRPRHPARDDRSAKVLRSGRTEKRNGRHRDQRRHRCSDRRSRRHLGVCPFGHLNRQLRDRHALGGRNELTYPHQSDIPLVSLFGLRPGVPVWNGRHQTAAGLRPRSATWSSPRRQAAMAISSKSPPLHHAVPTNRGGFRVDRNPRNFGRLARRVAVCEPNSRRSHAFCA